jgi:hypothetical protein
LIPYQGPPMSSYHLSIATLEPLSVLGKKIEQARFHHLGVSAIMARTPQELGQRLSQNPVDFILFPLDDRTQDSLIFLDFLLKNDFFKNIPRVGTTLFSPNDLPGGLLARFDFILEEPLPRDLWIEKVRGFLSKKTRAYERVRDFLKMHHIKATVVSQGPKPQQGPISVTLWDLSQGGMLLYSSKKEAFSPGESIHFVFPAPGGSTPIRGTGKIARVARPKADPGEFYGVTFENLDKGALPWIKNFVMWEKTTQRHIEEWFYEVV